MTETAGWWYLLAHPAAVRVEVAHPAALLLLAATPVFVMWWRRDAARRAWVLGLRLAAVTCLVLALADVALTTRLPSTRLSLIAAVDISQSIDAAGRRWEAGYLQRLAAALAPGDEFGVVAFARDADVVRVPGPPGPAQLPAAGGASGATDIARGLATALALLAPDMGHRIVLLSDGNQTRGDALAQIPLAARLRAPVYAAVPPHEAGVDVAVEKLLVPALVAADSIFSMRVVLRNPGAALPAELAIAVDDAPAGSQRLLLPQGASAVDVSYRLHRPGSHRVRVQVSVTGDTVPGNNYREAAVTVGGQPRVLLVTPGRGAAALAAALQRKQIAVTALAPGALPEQAEGLLGYHCVVLAGVGARALSGARLAAVERYVRDFGGGLVVAAGAETFGDAGFARTPLARLLPVTIEPHRPPRTEREPLALFILIDRSNSMGYHVRNRLERSETESKLAYAKRAALAVVEQLKDSDEVGLIVFDSEPFEVAPLRSLKHNRAVLETDIPRLQPGGGTDFYDALESARKQLLDASTSTRHIMLLTDGDTNRGAADHYPLIDALAKSGISVTTIRIGDDAVNLKLLTDISDRTGGQFYHVREVETLPELLLKDTKEALARAPGAPERFTPRLGVASQMLRGIRQPSLPSVSSYAYTRAKPGADVPLYVRARAARDPLLSAWQYGLGRVVAFTAGLDDDAADWGAWDGYGKLWSQIVHWAMRDETPWDYAVEAHRRDGQLHLAVRTFDDMADGVLLARLYSGPDHGVDVPLTPRAPRQFTGLLPALPGGRYPLTITGRGARQRTQMVLVPERDEEPQEEFEAAQPNRPLLRALAAGSGGAVDAPVGAIVARTLGQQRARRPLEWLLIPAAMLLFLADVGVRRLGRAAAE